MIEKEVHIDSLIEQLEAYGEANIDLVKLKTLDKTSDVLSSLASVFFVFLLGVFSTLLISVGVSLLIGKLLGNDFWGFLIVGVLYIITAFIIYKYKFDYLKKEAGDIIVREMLK